MTILDVGKRKLDTELLLRQGIGNLYTKHYKMTEKYKNHIDVRPLKQFAYEKLPESPLKEILLIEDDILDIDAFLARLPIWLRLSKLLT